MIQYFPIVTGSLTVLGNINVSGSITTSGSITISGSITSASFASTASYWSGSIVNAESASFVALAQSASYVLNAVSSSFATSASYWSGSIVNAESASFVANAQTASYVLNAVSSSFASTASFVALAQSASNAVSAVTASFANNLTVAGTLTAQTLVVQTITSSVDFVTGSTKFGSILANTHVFSGSVTMNPGGLFVSSSGRVGINTTNPLSLFDVAVLTSGVRRLLVNYDDSLVTIKSANDSATAESLRVWGDNIYFYTGSAGSELMRLTNTGRVGIGTTAPNYTLHIDSNTTLTRFQITNSTTGQGGGVGLQIIQNGLDASITNRSNGYLGFETVGTERVRITSSGSVVFSSINTNAAIAANGLYYYVNASLVDDHAAIVLLLGTYNYATYKIDVVVSISDTIETIATLLVDIKESTVQSTILGGIATTNLAVVGESSPVGTDTKFNFILNAQSCNSYLAIRNRRGGDRRLYVKIECLSTR